MINGWIFQGNGEPWALTPKTWGLWPIYFIFDVGNFIVMGHWNSIKKKSKNNNKGRISWTDWSLLVEGFTKDGIGYIPSTLYWVLSLLQF